MARPAFSRYKNTMVRFCAIAVVALVTLDVAVHAGAEEAPNTRAYHLDESLPEQQYTEDCQVCCRPIVLDVTVDPDGDVSVLARSENE